MASVVHKLNSYSITLPVPLQPAFFMHSNIDSESTSRWEKNTWVTESAERPKGKSIQALIRK
ncbi:hypothetical protein FH972_016420 [Carpinus fangiana]|uniref:Uncharacterized protein n=1 Tax=Carpinus fangiana TaxID=176857 RepID=A0A5N6RG41_9ROSI|nr:hypothetical protein FH972_016420 [Carpinus fangiana]